MHINEANRERVCHSESELQFQAKSLKLQLACFEIVVRLWLKLIRLTAALQMS